MSTLSLIGVLIWSTVLLAQAPNVAGDWLGTLNAGPLKLRLIFHIVSTEKGLTATADSPDQNATGMPVSAVTVTGTSVKLEMPAIGAMFEGKVAADGAQIDGTFTQNGTPIPLVLARVTSAEMLERRRPQNPVKPFPYRDEDVAIDNAGAGVRLAGTLTTPEGKGPFTAVVLISGSGPQDRDESLMGHRPFAVLADHLTRKGIAVLRLDDRGIGKSTGRFAAATSADFASDTEAAVTYLEARPEIDRRKIGLVGHSEGGLIAAMIAARNAHVAFVVMMAGTGVRGDELLIAQAGAVLEGMGASAEAVQQAIAKQRELVTAIRTEPDDAAALAKLRDIVGPAVPQAQLSAQFQQLRSPWFKFFLDYDPAISLRNVHVPVLAINGEKDRQVPPAQNLPPIRQALAAAGNKNVEVLELPGLNHLFQTAKTGAPIEYAEIEETISPTALDTISRWILQR